MNLKNKFAVGIVGATVLCAFGAELISGDYNTTLGYLAGKDASGDRVTAMGAGAAGESEDNERSSFFGAASGTYSKRIVDCVAIGYRSLKNALDNIGSMFIGNHAGEESSDMIECVVNGEYAGASSSTCSNCVFIGVNSGRNVTDLKGCIFIGSGSGSDVQSGSSGCVDIGGMIRIGMGEMFELFGRKGEDALIKVIEYVNNDYSYTNKEIRIRDDIFVLIGSTVFSKEGVLANNVDADTMVSNQGVLYNVGEQDISLRNYISFGFENGEFCVYTNKAKAAALEAKKTHPSRALEIEDEDTGSKYIVKVKSGALKLYNAYVDGSITNEVGTIQVSPCSD